MALGLLLLVAAALAIAWILWRDRDTRQDAARAALQGISHEYRMNLKRLMAELSSIASGNPIPPSALRPSTHPQLDAVNANMIDTDRRPIAVMNASYRELDGRAITLRGMVEAGQDASEALKEAIESTIDGVTTLYLWDEHKGRSPEHAHSTRSWHVRDWMKGNNFDSQIFPGMHLRDEAVERLRTYGMHLTPQPLTHTANEYYAMKYDRNADPEGVFGKKTFDEDGNVVRFWDRLPFFGKGDDDDTPRRERTERRERDKDGGEKKKRFNMDRFRKSDGDEAARPSRSEPGSAPSQDPQEASGFTPRVQGE